MVPDRTFPGRDAMDLLSQLWNGLPGPAVLGSQLTIGLWDLSRWLSQDYRGLVLVILIAGFALSWIGLSRHRH
jgi:hypothetical protein